MRDIDENAGPPSPLSGTYLLVVLSEPQSQTHKDAILDKLTRGILSWDSAHTHVDIDRELSDIANQAPLGEDSKNGERIIQLASDALVIEILIQPTMSTFRQCLRNLLSSFTRHRHVIHAGYSLAGTGSWLLQDGTFEFDDLVECLKDLDVQRLHRVYDQDISLHICCNPEGSWTSESLTKDPSIAALRVVMNPAELSSIPSPGMTRFIRHVSDILPVIRIEKLLQPSDVVGNIRFSKPTLYVFPGGQGDSALFGINGFNILIDGGFARKPCFWDFTRHMDRLDAVLSTRFNTSSLLGLSSAVSRKSANPVFPQIGHFFCNFPGRVEWTDSSNPLSLNVVDVSQQMASQLETLQLKPQPAYREDSKEPINLYHKVGHGTLDMFILSPSRDSKEVKEFLRLWKLGNPGALGCAQGSVKIGRKEFQVPLLDMISICALIVWQPADPTKPATRLLFSGSAPQSKIFEGMEKWRHLDFLKSPASMSLQTNHSELDSTAPKPILNKKKSRNNEERAKSATPPRPVNGKIEVKLLKNISASPRPKEHHSNSVRVIEKVGSVQTASKTEAKPSPQEKPKTQKPKYEVKSKINSNWNQSVKSISSESPKAVEILAENPLKPGKKDRLSSGETVMKLSKTNPVSVQVNKPKVDLKGIEAKVGSFKTTASPSPKRVPEKKTPEKIVIKAPAKPDRKAEKPAKFKDEVKTMKNKAATADLSAKVQLAPSKVNESSKSSKKKQPKNDFKSKESEKKAAGSLQVKAVKRPVKVEAPAAVPVVPVVPQHVPEPKTELNFIESAAPQAASSPILNKTFDFDEEDRLHDPFLNYRIVPDPQIDINGALDTSTEELKELASSDEDPVDERSRNALLTGHQSNLEDEEEIVIKNESFSLEDGHEKVKERLTLDYFGAISASEMEGLNESRESSDTAYEEADDEPLNSSENPNSAGSYEEVHDLDETRSSQGSLKSRTLEPELELSQSRLEQLAKEAFILEDAGQESTKEEVQDPEILLQEPPVNHQPQLELETPGTFQNPAEYSLDNKEDEVFLSDSRALEHDQVKEDTGIPGILSFSHTEELQVTEKSNLTVHLQEYHETRERVSQLGLIEVAKDFLEQPVEFQVDEEEVVGTSEHNYQLELEVTTPEKNIDTSSVVESFKKDVFGVLVQESQNMPVREPELKLESDENNDNETGFDWRRQLEEIPQEPLMTVEHASGVELELKLPGTFQNSVQDVLNDHSYEEDHLEEENVIQETCTKELNLEVTVPGVLKKTLDNVIHDEVNHTLQETVNLDVEPNKQDFVNQLEEAALSPKNSINDNFEVEDQMLQFETRSGILVQDEDGFLDKDEVGKKLQDIRDSTRPGVHFHDDDFHAESDDVVEVVDNIYSVQNIREVDQTDADEYDPNVSLELTAEAGVFTQLEKAAGEAKSYLTSVFDAEHDTEDTVFQSQEDITKEPEVTLNLESGKLERTDFYQEKVIDTLERTTMSGSESEFNLERDPVPEVIMLEEVIDKLEKVAEDVKDSFQNTLDIGSGETHDIAYQTNATLELHSDAGAALTLEKVIEKLEKVTEDVTESLQNASLHDAEGSLGFSELTVNDTTEMKIPEPTVTLEMDIEQSQTFHLEHDIHAEDITPNNAVEELNFEEKSLADDVDSSDMEEDHSQVPVDESFGQKDALPLCFTAPGEAGEQVVQDVSRQSESSSEEEEESPAPVEEEFALKDANPLCFTLPGEAAGEPSPSESSSEEGDEFPVPVTEKFESKDSDPLCFTSPEEPSNPFIRNNDDDKLFRTHDIVKDPFSLEFHAQNPFTAIDESALPKWATRKDQESFEDDAVPKVDDYRNETEVSTVTAVAVPSFEANVITTSENSVTVPITGAKSIHLSQEYIVFQQPGNIHEKDEVDDVREEVFFTSSGAILESAKVNGKENDDEELPEVHENFTAEFIKRKPVFSDDENESEESLEEVIEPEKPTPSKPIRIVKPRPVVDSDSDLEEVEETFTAVRVTRQVQFSERQNEGEVNMEFIQDLPGTEVDPGSESESEEEQDSQEEIHFSLKKSSQINAEPVEGPWGFPDAGANLSEEFNHQKFVKQTIEIDSRISANHIQESNNPFTDWSERNPFSEIGSTPVIEDNFHKHIIQSGSDTEDDEAKAEDQITSLSSNFSSRTYDLNAQSRSSEIPSELKETNPNNESQSGPCSFNSDVSATSEVRERGVFNDHFTTSAFSSGPASWAGYEDSPDPETPQHHLRRQDRIDAEDAASEHSFTSSVSDDEQHSDVDSGTIQDKITFVPDPSVLHVSWNSRSLTGIKEIDEREESEPIKSQQKTGAAMTFSSWAKLTEETDPYENMMDDDIGQPIKDPVVFGTRGETQHYFNPFTSDENIVESSRGPFEISENVTVLDDDSSTNGSDQDLFHERQLFRVTTTTTRSSIDVPGAQGIDPVIVDPFGAYSAYTDEDILRSWGKPLGLPAPIAPQLSNGDNRSNSGQSSPARKSPSGSNMKTNLKGNGHKDFVPFYVDLAFVPHHADAKYSDVDFFKKVRARHYVFSGLEPSTKVLDALIEAKEAWSGADKDLDVTIIPTYDSESLGSWISTNEARLARNRIDLAPSASRCTINLQDHKTSCSAYRLEF